MAPILHFECSRCAARLYGGDKAALSPADFPTVCRECAGSLYVRYDLGALKGSFTRESLAGRPATMWRYREVLPAVEPVSLGEGFTPMVRSRRHANAWIKDEGLNPTGSFKARGLGMAVTMARHYGLKKLAIPSAGNAAGAMAAYCAAAGIESFIFMPRDVPQANVLECEAYGAHVTLVDGLISDCGRIIAERKEKEGWFEIATLKEPFRVEGKKTMGYEIAEQMAWELPDAVFYPTGGGVGMIGMWKAFDEMEALGWIGSKRPKMISIQAAGCAPIVKAWEAGKAASEPWKDASTLAAGLRVPKAYADYIVLDIVRTSDGTAIAIPDDEIVDGIRRWAREEGFFASPEGAAAFVAYEKLLASKFLSPKDKVVLFNTGSAYKYVDMLSEALGIPDFEQRTRKLPATRALGGIIQPY